MKKLAVFLIAVVSIGAAWAEGEPTTPDPKQVVTSRYYVDTEIATKQPKLQQLGSDYIVTYPVVDVEHPENTTPTSRQISGTVSDAAADANKIPTVGAVNSALSNKQGLIGGGTDGTVILNSGTPGTVQEKAIYSTTNNATTGLLQANDANTIVQTQLNAHITCSSPANGDSTNCLLWQINTLQ